MQGLDEVRRWASGGHVASLHVHHVPVSEVHAIRSRTGLSQAEFSRQIGVSAATLRDWEQGRRQPDGPACVLLAMLARDPTIVARTLADAA